MTRRRAALALTVLAALAAPASALGPASWDLELDPYYTALDYTVPFVKGAEEGDVEAGEAATYRGMLTRALVPRYMVLEASLNPLPLAGAGVRSLSESAYQKLQIEPSINLLEAVTAGFEEPWALSMFLGKVIDFQKGAKTIVGRAQKGYTGYLFSVGNEHLMNCLMIPDKWLEAEWKVKGDESTERRKMSWSFRGGTKLHESRDIANTFYVGLRRSRVDFQPGPWSWLTSSAFEYKMDVNARTLRPIEHFILVEKNFPLPRGKMVFSLGLGYQWIGQDKYSGSLALRRRPNETQVLLRPNLKF